MAWFFRKKDEEPKKNAEPRSILGETIVADEERLGPAPPPPRTAHAPRVAVYRSAGADPARPADGRVVTLAPEETLTLRGEAGALETSVLVLSGTLSETSGARPLAAGPGDFLFGAPGGHLCLVNDRAAPASVLVDRGAAARAEPGPARRIGRDELVGTGFPGITGIRAVRRTPGAVSLRLGPPPGARWVLVGLRSLAVFTGRMTLVDGEEPLLVRAGELALIGDPTATLYLQAGNDSALALGFATPGLVVALG